MVVLQPDFVLPGCLLQVVANYVAKTPQGKIFDSSLDKGKPYDIRVGAGQVCSEDRLGLTAVNWIHSLEMACISSVCLAALTCRCTTITCSRALLIPETLWR